MFLAITSADFAEIQQDELTLDKIASVAAYQHINNILSKDMVLIQVAGEYFRRDANGVYSRLVFRTEAGAHGAVVFQTSPAFYANVAQRVDRASMEVLIGAYADPFAAGILANGATPENPQPTVKRAGMMTSKFGLMEANEQAPRVLNIVLAIAVDGDAPITEQASAQFTYEPLDVTLQYQAALELTPTADVPGEFLQWEKTAIAEEEAFAAQQAAFQQQIMQQLQAQSQASGQPISMEPHNPKRPTDNGWVAINAAGENDAGEKDAGDVNSADGGDMVPADSDEAEVLAPESDAGDVPAAV